MYSDWKEGPMSVCMIAWIGLPQGLSGKKGDPPGMQQMQVRSLGWEDSPGGGHSNSLQYSCLENPTDRGAWQVQSMGLQRVGHN